MSDAETPSPAPAALGEDLPTTPLTDESMTFIESLKRRAEAGIDERTHRIAELQRETKDLRAVHALASNVRSALDDGLVGTALLSIDRAKDARSYLATSQPEASRQLDELRERLLAPVDEVLRNLARTLPPELEARGVTLDASSRDPKYSTDQSFIQVQVDRKTRSATIQTRGTKKERVAVDPAVLADRIAEERQRCFARTPDLASFASSIRQAVTAIAPSSPRVPIKKAFEEVRKADKSVVLDEFMVDLAQLVVSGSQSIVEAAGLRLDHTKHADEGLLLPGLEDRGYFGYIGFDD